MCPILPHRKPQTRTFVCRTRGLIHGPIHAFIAERTASPNAVVEDVGEPGGATSPVNVPLRMAESTAASIALAAASSPNE
mmetsp:Transcript_25825/g.65669  ORF Transcript_25825/g.65669 Transcript_25825/m.65669 type:complete len:80 (+) Transcript_25825:433-672(+)